MIRPLLDYKENGFDLQTDNDVLWCYPFIFALLGDLPENAAMTLTFNSVNCSCPYHMCLIKGDNLNNVKLNDDQITLRTPENITQVMEENLKNQYSIYSISNIFGNTRKYTIYCIQCIYCIYSIYTVHI